MSRAFYSVSKKGDTVTILARDRDAKQVLFGWAGQGVGDAELYGRGTGRGAGDGEVWEWKLSSHGVGSLYHGISAMVADPKRWGTSEREWKALNELRVKLAKLGITGGGSRLHTYGGKRRKTTPPGKFQMIGRRRGARVSWVQSRFGWDALLLDRKGRSINAINYGLPNPPTAEQKRAAQMLFSAGHQSGKKRHAAPRKLGVGKLASQVDAMLRR